MYLLDHTIECLSTSDRVEIFPIFDFHGGKRNCAEKPAKKQVKEIARRNTIKGRHARVLFGGDQLNAINKADVRRFDFDELADWVVAPSDEELKKGLTSGEIAELVRARLSNMVDQEINHTVGIFEPVKHLTLGAITGNHETMMRRMQSLNIHSAFCSRMEIQDLTDEALIRIHMVRRQKAGKIVQVATVVIYLRHGYGGGRTAGAEPNKLDRMLAEWEAADVCLTGHSHTFCILPPKPVAILPTRGKLPKELFYRYRFAANPGCWLFSHKEGVGSYESMACYPARPMMTLKIVIWPFWATTKNCDKCSRPKIELRDYAIT